MKNSQGRENSEDKEYILKKRERIGIKRFVLNVKLDNISSDYNIKEKKSIHDKKQFLNSKEKNEENISTRDGKPNFENPASEEADVSNLKIPLKSEKDSTKCLLITNLQRPFVNSALEALLSKYGKINNFWLDFIKTHCYVEYENISQAKDAKKSLDGAVWPVDGKKLIIDYVPESELHQAKDKNPAQQNTSYDKDKDKLSALKTQIKPNDSTPTNLNLNNKVTNIQNEEDTVKTLDSLFKKTETKPHLYFLPLSEEEVQDKKLKLNR